MPRTLAQYRGTVVASYRMRELTADQQVTVLYALRVMAKDTRATGKDRREARDVYQHLVTRVMSDDDFRPYDCTGGMWCRCPVSTPCAQRGTSHVTGHVAAAT